MTDETSTPVRRRPGRPRGLGRVPGSGRKPGQPNAVAAELRTLIIDKYKPADFLGRLVLGMKIRVGPPAGPNRTFAYPDLNQRLRAAEILMAKVMPDLRSSEVTGAEGEPLLPAPVRLTDDQLKLSLVALWRSAEAR